MKQHTVQVPSTGLRQMQSRQRRAFLLVEAFAGGTLVLIALSLTLWILKKDQDLRRQLDHRLEIIQTSENLLERCSNLPFEALTQEGVEQIHQQVLIQSGRPSFELKISIDATLDTPKRKRLHVVGLNQANQVQVQLWRDFYQEMSNK